MAAGDIPSKARVRLRLGENPYAFVEFEGAKLLRLPLVVNPAPAPI
jgi:hypothetical protein